VRIEKDETAPPENHSLNGNAKNIPGNLRAPNAQRGTAKKKDRGWSPTKTNKTTTREKTKQGRIEIKLALKQKKSRSTTKKGKVE